MTRSNDADGRRHTIWLILVGLSLLVAPSPVTAQHGAPNRLRSDLAMPSPHVRRRVPIKRSQVSSYEADRARQALMHAQPTRHFVPKHERLAAAEAPMEPIPSASSLVTGEEFVTEEVYRGESVPNAPSYADGYTESFDDEGYYEEGYSEPSYGSNCDCGQCGGGDSCGCGFDCGGGCGGGCEGYEDISGYPFGALWGMGNLEVFAGGLGFTGPYNQGSTGSFGFQEGFNFGTVLPLLPYSGLGWQIGTRSTQTNLSGASFTTEERHQTFFTTGIFKRACCGWQGGIVVDVLQDEWFAEANTTQLRGEFSYRWPTVHEFGYRFSAALRDDQITSPIVAGQLETFEGSDLHSFFYRRRLNWAPGGQVSIFAGFSGDDDGYLGTDIQLPLSDFFAIRSSLSYLHPDESVNDGASEAWNASVMLVFNLRGSRPGSQQAKFSPLLDVADNGNFILNRILP